MLWIYYLLLIVVALAGLGLAVFGLPGLWLMVAATAGYAWWTGFDIYIGWPALGTLFGLAIVAEIVELAAGSAGAARAGASKRAMVGAIVGALLGGVLLTGLLPIPLVGTVFGICLGAFIGAALVELVIRRDVAHSFRVGTGAAKGRLYGIVTKLAFGALMLLIVIVTAIPLGAGQSIITVPSATSGTSVPATAPAN